MVGIVRYLGCRPTQDIQTVRMSTAACKAFSLANAKGKGTNGLVIRSVTHIIYNRILYIIRTLLKEIDGFLREISLKIAKFP